MNAAHISGNLATDVEFLEFDEKSLSKFTLASNHADRVVFIPVEVWNQQHLTDYLQKGSRALVSGFLKQDQWENEDGERRSRIVLVGQSVEFLDRKRESSRPQSGNGKRPQQKKPHSRSRRTSSVED